MAVLRWKKPDTVAVHLMALCDFQGIPETALFRADHTLKTPSELMEEGVLPERIWRPYAA